MMIYLDNAATTFPKPPGVIDAMVRAMNECGNPGRSGHPLALKAGRIVMETREELADFLGAPSPEHLVFCSNCTDALNLAIKGIVQKGWHVATTVWEHNSVLRVLKSLEAQGIINLSIKETLEEAMTEGTNLAVCAHASNVTGAIQPIAALGRRAHALGALFIVDAAQSAGILPLTLESANADMIAMPGHKGLYGPQGTGALVIAKHVIAQLKALKEGGTGTSSASFYQPDEIPERFESGTVNTPGIAGLFAGVKFVRAHQQEIYEHELGLTKQLIEALNNIQGVTIYGPDDPTDRVGVVAFNVDGVSSGEIADALGDEEICVRAGLHCAPGAHITLNTINAVESGMIRASVGFFNTSADIKEFGNQVNRIAKTLR
jgi:cysteine desulfurase family protein